MYWRTILEALLILGGLKEIFRVLIDYKSGQLNAWPFGFEIGCGTLVIAGFFLIKAGIKRKTQYR